jgi:DNA polymerase-3 subunit epsilon
MNMRIVIGIDENGNFYSEFINESDVKPEKRSKGKSQLECIDDYVVVDLETTGLDPHYDEIIEIGALKVKGGLIVDQYNTLVKPDNEVDDFITSLTGITNEMLKKAPKIDSVLPEFLSFLGSEVLVAHNANFDVNFLFDNCKNILNASFSNNFIDTMRMSRHLFKDFKNHKLRTLIENFKIGDIVSHRSISDCMHTYKCYEYMKNHIESNNIDFNALTKSSFSTVKAKDITTKVELFNTSHPFYDKTCVFTGTLEKVQRKEAMQLVADLGGVCVDGVNKKVDFLILGNNDYCASIKDGKSNKQKKAEQYILEGYDITIISENVFYEILAM